MIAALLSLIAAAPLPVVAAPDHGVMLTFTIGRDDAITACARRYLSPGVRSAGRLVQPCTGTGVANALLALPNLRHRGRRVAPWSSPFAIRA